MHDLLSARDASYCEDELDHTALRFITIAKREEPMDPTTMNGKVIPEDTSSFTGIQNSITSAQRGGNASV